MAQNISPGVFISEFDATTIIPQVSTTTGAYAGPFKWGPVGERTLISSETNQVGVFGPPTNFNAEGWFSLANFLAYGAPAWVVRTANLTSTNASIGAATATANVSPVTNALAAIVKNHDAYTNLDGTFEAALLYVAKWPGAMGNSIRVSECFTPSNYTSTINLASFGAGAVLSLNVGSNSATVTITGSSQNAANLACLSFANSLTVTDQVQFGNSDVGQQYLKVTGISYNTAATTGNSTSGTGTVTLNFGDILKIRSNLSLSLTLTRYWEFFSLVGVAPGTSAYVTANGNTAAQDEMHAVVVDDGGQFTGVPGTVLEVYKLVSRATDALAIDGGTNYYKNVINQRSQYVWWCNDYTSATSANSASIASATATTPLSLTMVGGADGAGEANVSPGVISSGWDLFASPEDVDVSLLIMGRMTGGINNTQTANYVMDNIASVRKDCVVFVSPQKADVVFNTGQEVTSITATRNQLRNTSYGFMDSGYKYMYDRYNDIYRWVPLNGDMAGLCARTDSTNDAWWSPAGFNRGQIKNLVKLAYSPRKADRDVLYPIGVNPVVSFKAQGTILYGDRTLLTKPSAFNRINVRRLFIVLEKAIGAAAQYTLFEFNDSFTQGAFRNMVNPYLRDIKGRRGITDFLVVDDSTVNTGFVIDSNQFVCNIFVKPARSINFLNLNFIAVPTGIQFSEVVGMFGGGGGGSVVPVA